MAANIVLNFEMRQLYIVLSKNFFIPSDRLL